MLRRIEAKKERKKKIWMGVILVFLMIFSIMGIFIGSSQSGGQSFEYNEFKFKRTDQNTYVTKINDQLYGFNFLPQSLLTINKSDGIASKLSAPAIYTTFDPNNEVQQLYYIDIVRNDLATSLNTYLISGITNVSDTYILPTLTCDNATPFVPVIYFNVSNETSIIDKDNCLVVNAEHTEFFRLRDLLLYLRFGVIDG